MISGPHLIHTRRADDMKILLSSEMERLYVQYITPDIVGHVTRKYPKSVLI